VGLSPSPKADVVPDNLFAHQVSGAAFLGDRKGALLADTMGLGKTRTAIAAADIASLNNILVLAPASVQINWQREFLKWSNASRPVYVASSRGSILNKTGVCIVGYQLAIDKRIRHQILASRWDLIIADEAHYLKEPDANRTQALYGPYCDGTNGFVSSADRTWLMTGTPTPNHPGELWVHLRNLHTQGIEVDGKLRSYADFLDHYTTSRPTKFGVKIIGGKNFEELREKIDPFVLKRTKEDVAHSIPPVTFGDVVLESDDLLKDIKALENGPAGDYIRDVLEGDDEIFDAGIEFAELSTLRRYVGLAKVKPTVDLIKNDLGSNREKMVVFAYHRDVIEALRLSLHKDFKTVTLTGDTSITQRQKAIDDFQEDPDTRLFIGQIEAAGTGINLFAGNQVLFVEQSWVPANNEQAVSRVHRTGQKSPVTVRFVSLAGTIDEAVTATLRRKTKIITELYR